MACSAALSKKCSRVHELEDEDEVLRVRVSGELDLAGVPSLESHASEDG